MITEQRSIHCKTRMAGDVDGEVAHLITLHRMGHVVEQKLGDKTGEL